MAKPIMIVGTMSNAGKSLVCAGLCRVFKQDGFRVAPFKSQNMALNSYITKENLEMGRAQVVQAEACGIEPSVLMNPILLKPTTDMGSQVIVRGEVECNMSAKEYYREKEKYRQVILDAYHELAEQYDIIVIEGAGSPAEINLKDKDFVNMGMAEMVDAPCLLVGDIDRGGVFAQLYGTVALLEPSEQDRIKGLLINKFRGDVKILEPGLKMLEDICGKEVLGVIPYMKVNIEDEDSLAEVLSVKDSAAQIDIAVIRLPKISNFTDFTALDLEAMASVRYVGRVEELKDPDLIILPGTKSTMDDLKWLRQTGLEAAIKKKAASGTLVFGVCGGYQIMGESVTDESGVEGFGTMRGMELLPIRTIFAEEKTRTRKSGVILDVSGPFASLSGRKIAGYEIHMGESEQLEEGHVFTSLEGSPDGCFMDNAAGSYLHGIFDEEDFRDALFELICERKGIAYTKGQSRSYQEYKEEQYDLLAEGIRASVDMERIYQILGLNQ